ncbi:fibronectin type III domain protein, partial [Opisthorchis viverrini]
PRAPENIRIEPVVNTSSATASWTFDVTCGTTRFTVDTYNEQNLLVGTQSTSEQTVVFNRLQGCVPLTIGVTAHNQQGTSPEARSERFTLLTAPGPPRYLRVEPNELDSSVDVSWESGYGCAASVFLVQLRRPDGSIEANLNTTQYRITISNVPKCTKFFATVLGQNDKGSGSQRQSNLFTIPAVIPGPNNVQVETIENTSSVRVSWKNENLCPSSEFVVTVLEQGGRVVYTEYSNVQKTVLRGLPACVSLQIKIAVHDGSEDSQQALSKAFYLLAAPNRPRMPRVTTEDNEPTANITWEDGGGCIATAYDVSVKTTNGTMVTFLNTSSRSVTLTDIPMCASLYATVVARNEYGSSSAITSMHFTIQT